MKEHSEGGGDADSCRGAGTHGEQRAGLDQWPLVDFLYLQPLPQLGRVAGEGVP